jgi:hypothetical protein
MSSFSKAHREESENPFMNFWDVVRALVFRHRLLIKDRTLA